MKRFIVRVALLVTCVGCLASFSFAAEFVAERQVPQDVLEAEAAGLVEVRYIPNDSRSAQIVVANRTAQPLTLRLPEAFAGVPVLAQVGGFGQGMGGMGGGLFSVPPEKTKVVKVATVCLEHGKTEPAPRIPYRLARLDAFSDDPALAALLVALGRRELPQRVAQAAAWHLSSGRSWQELAAEKIDRPGGVPDVPYFSPAELYAARQAVSILQEQAEKQASQGHGGGRVRSSGEG